MTGSHPLDNPVLSSLTGPDARWAEQRGRVQRYLPDVSPFLALPDEPNAADWADAAALVGPGGRFALAGVRVRPPDGWDLTVIGEGVQMIDAGVEAGPDGEAVPLGLADVPEMLALAGRTKPGPFLPRTVELGRYLGIRRGGELVAMAGERLHPPGWTEISAVCTDEGWRGHGFAALLTRALVASIKARGQTALLHAVATNTGAIALYERLGFRLRRHTVFSAVRAPAKERADRGVSI